MSFNQINFYKSLGQTKSVNSNKVSPVWLHDEISEDKLENAPVGYLVSNLRIRSGDELEEDNLKTASCIAGLWPIINTEEYSSGICEIKSIKTLSSNVYRFLSNIYKII